MLIGAILIGRELFTSNGGGNDKLDVPNMVGSTVSEAQKLADNAEVELKVGSKEPCEAQEKDRICSQTPDKDSQMAKGETVTVVVSTGAPKVEVPDVLEKSEDSARKALEDKGFTVNVKTAESDKTLDTVIAQDPEGGTKADKDQEVTITVAKEATQNVPGVVGRSFTDAEAQLKGVGFVNVSRTDVDSDEPVDTVIEQTPEANSKESKDVQIVLKVSKGPAEPEQVGVPDLQNKTLAEAKDALAQAGLKLGTVQGQDDDNARVIGFQPQAGQMVDKDSAVNVQTLPGGDGGLFGH